GHEVVIFLFTRRYEASWPIFAIAVSILPMNAIVLDPVTRAHSERFFFLRLRLIVLGVLTTVLALYASELGLVGVMASVFTAIASIWLVGVWRMSRMLEIGRTELRAFAPVGWIAASTLTAAAVAAVVHALVAGRPPVEVIAICAVVFGAVYATVLGLSGVIALAEVWSLLRDLRRAATGAGALF